jgi:hypothetical protein
VTEEGWSFEAPQQLTDAEVIDELKKSSCFGGIESQKKPFAKARTRRGPIPGGPLVYVAGTFSKWTSLTQIFLILRGCSPHYFSSNSLQKSGWLGTSF